MKFCEIDISGVFIIEPKVFSDDRGFFCETYRKNLFSENGITDEFIQDNHSSSVKGVLRGLHYQEEPRMQAKLVRAVKGSVFDVIVDIRKGSKTFGKSLMVELSAENRKMLYIPKGFAHGFCATEDVEFVYKTSDYYAPEHERGIIWNDPILAIPWPEIGQDYILSEKDSKYPTFEEATKNL